LFKKKLILANTYRKYKNDNFKQPKYQYETLDSRRKKEKSVTRAKEAYLHSDKKVKKSKPRLINNLFKSKLNINSTQDLTGSTAPHYRDMHALHTPNKMQKTYRALKTGSTKKRGKK
jgi:hypothetical protein